MTTQAAITASPSLFANPYRVDVLQVGLLLVSFVLAYLLPLELFLVSYAFLGPAHYLTQISWLHERKYFTGNAWLAVPFIIIGLMVVFIVPPWSMELIVISLCYALALILLKDIHYRIWLTVLASALLIAAMHVWQLKILVFFIPTLIHVFVFTAAFMLLGAMRSHSVPGYAAFAVMLLCGASFFVLPAHPMTQPVSVYVRENITLLQHVYIRFVDFLYAGDERSTVLTQAARFTAFAYTYHYLNWFSKTGIIGWSRHLTFGTSLAIGLLYVFFIAVYLYDYATGFTLILFLSFLHVLLEFPLNIVCFRDIGKKVWRYS